jgi:hypothetical protein
MERIVRSAHELKSLREDVGNLSADYAHHTPNMLPSIGATLIHPRRWESLNQVALKRGH